MTWKPTGHPLVHHQRDGWVVRVNGIETSSGKARPRQLGTFRSRRAAQQAAAEFGASGEVGSDRSTVGSVVTRWAESRTDIGNKSRLQYEWAVRHISEGLGSVRLDRLDRADMARWLEGLAHGGHFSGRSISICRTVLRARARRRGAGARRSIALHHLVNSSKSTIDAQHPATHRPEGSPGALPEATATDILNDAQLDRRLQPNERMSPAPAIILSDVAGSSGLYFRSSIPGRRHHCLSTASVGQTYN